MKRQAALLVRERPLRERAQVGPRLLKDPQSVEFAWQTCALLKTTWQYKRLSAEGWERVLVEADQHRIYERIPPEHPYGSLDAMLKAEIGVGLEESREQLKAALDAAPPVGPGQGKRTDLQLPSIRRKLREGTSRAYLAARLKRDHPEICARIEAGEFKSMRAAAIAAGIVKVKSPLEQLQHWWRKASAAEREQFRRETA